MRVARASAGRLRTRGVTLLEVLISMGIAFIGLLGVAAMLPVAIYYLNRGVVADNAAVFGRSAVSEFKARQMSRANMWAVWNPNTNAFVAFRAEPAETQPLNFVSPLVGQAASFCIDGLMLARCVRDGNVPPSFFPAVPFGVDETRMARVTLRTQPGASPIIPPGNPNPLFTIPYLTADEIFFLTDQLSFTRPKDRTLPPVPDISLDANSFPEKRQFDPNLSWFATLSPIVGPSGGNPLSDMYTLSIVVVEARDMRSDMSLNNSDEPVERVVDVYFHRAPGAAVPTGDWAGGSVVLVSRPNRSEKDLEVRPGHWVMLSGRFAPGGASVFRWYRVVSADRDTSVLTAADVALLYPPTASVGGPYREVALQGLDWNPNAVVRTQATIISGVVAVLEKTVRIESSSLWTR
ncbi:MAG: hypothetical protein KatS3mg109_1608 [Pirellulaceae bacterium]|nr:MAG: hypothetical protein KatS3mg109_1608 [Pirellulaceae bacterium]